MIPVAAALAGATVLLNRILRTISVRSPKATPCMEHAASANSED